MDNSTKDAFAEITNKPYAAQAQTFLNAFWKKGIDKEAENVWIVVQKFVEIDEKLKKNGCELDEFQSHRILEHFGGALTVIALREELRKIDIDNNRRMAAAEYLLFRYKKAVEDLVKAPKGDNQEEIDKAKKKLDEVQTSLEKLMKQLAEQEEALKKVKEQEEKVKLAEAELRDAVAALEAEETAYNTKLAELEKMANDSTLSAVKRGKATNERDQLKSQDPLPLRKAKISQQAALRKVEKERKACEQAVAECEASKKRVEAAVADTQKKYDEAVAYLEDVKNRSGNAEGSIWWMNRELEETAKYLPKKKSATAGK